MLLYTYVFVLICTASLGTADDSKQNQQPLAVLGPRSAGSTGSAGSVSDAVDRLTDIVHAIAEELKLANKMHQLQPDHAYNDSTPGGPCESVLIQQNIDGSSFDRSWSDYRRGFGDPSTNFWIGNEALHRLTTSPASKNRKLRVIFHSLRPSAAYWAEYDTFRVENETLGYKLLIGGFKGSVGFDTFAEQNGMKFSTRDRDQDPAATVNCAQLYGGGFWYRNCAQVALNAVMKSSTATGFFHRWNYIPGSADGALSYSRMLLVCR